nr:hypothetical protein MarFTME_313 [Marseillevirus futianmevirus]
MEFLANETLSHVIDFLDGKSALIFSTTSRLNRGIVLSKLKVVRKRLVAENSEETDIFELDDVEKIQNSSPNASEEMGCLFNGKKIGVWRKEEKGQWGIFAKKIRSSWTDGVLNYVHIHCALGETISFPRGIEEGEYTTEFEGKTLACAFFVGCSFPKECGGKKYDVFEDKNGNKFRHCCEKHRGEMPKSLFA